MLPVALHGIITMDIEELQKDILAAYDTDPAVQSFHADPDNSKYSCWSVDNVGFIWINQRILVPESGDLWLCILQSFYDHQSPDILVSTKLFQSFNESILGLISESL
jgi:hypothetical protein